MPNLDPAFELGKRLSSMEQRIRSIETKSPVFEIFSGFGNTNGFALGTSNNIPNLQDLAPVTATIPSGFSQAFVMVTSDIQAEALIASPYTNDWMTPNAVIKSNSPGIGSAWSGGPSVYGTSNGSGAGASPLPYASAWPAMSYEYTGLQAGYTITASIQAYTGTGWAYGSNNIASVTLNIFFFP